MDTGDPSSSPDSPDNTGRVESSRLLKQIDQAQKPSQRLAEAQGLLKQSLPRGQLHDLLRKLEPSMEIHKSLQLSLSKHLQESLASTSLASHMQNLVDQQSSLKAFANLDVEALRKATSSSLDIEALRKMTSFDAIGQMAKQHERLAKPFEHLQGLSNLMATQTLSGLNVQQIVSRFEQSSPGFLGMEEAYKTLSASSPKFKDLDFGQFNTDEKDEAARAASEISSTTTDNSTLHDAVEKIVAAIEAERQPAVKALLWLLFITLFEMLISAVVSTVVSVSLIPLISAATSPQAETKAVKEGAH